jgi:Peptidase M76 family
MCKPHSLHATYMASFQGQRLLICSMQSLSVPMQVCVRRRAELSVAMNPHCGPKKAKAAVDKVFDQCFADTAPFDRCGATSPQRHVPQASWIARDSSMPH